VFLLFLDRHPVPREGPPLLPALSLARFRCACGSGIPAYYRRFRSGRPGRFAGAFVRCVSHVRKKPQLRLPASRHLRARVGELRFPSRAAPTTAHFDRSPPGTGRHRARRASIKQPAHAAAIHFFRHFSGPRMSASGREQPRTHFVCVACASPWLLRGGGGGEKISSLDPAWAARAASSRWRTSVSAKEKKNGSLSATVENVLHSGIVLLNSIKEPSRWGRAVARPPPTHRYPLGRTYLIRLLRWIKTINAKHVTRRGAPCRHTIVDPAQCPAHRQHRCLFLRVASFPLSSSAVTSPLLSPESLGSTKLSDLPYRLQPSCQAVIARRGSRDRPCNFIARKPMGSFPPPNPRQTVRVLDFTHAQVLRTPPCPMALAISRAVRCCLPPVRTRSAHESEAPC